MSNLSRIFLNVAIVLALVFLPWWIACGVAFVACWFYLYYEAIFVGFFIDVVYQSHYFFHIGHIYFRFPFTFFALVALVVLRLVRKRVRYYQ